MQKTGSNRTGGQKTAKEAKHAPVEEKRAPTALCIAFEEVRQESNSSGSLKKREEKAGQQERVDENGANTSPDGQDDARTGAVFRQLIEARKAAEARLKEQEETYGSLLAMKGIGEHAGEVAGEMARQITGRRLAAEGGTEKLQAVLKLLDEQEAAIRSRLGLPSLEKENEAAIRIADVCLSGRPSGVPPASRADARSPEPAFRQGNMHELIQSAESYFRLYSGEPDHEIRMRHIRQYFRDPVRLNEFLVIHAPENWAGRFKYLYDNIIISPSRHAEADAGQPADAPAGERDRELLSTAELIRKNMERMGL